MANSCDMVPKKTTLFSQLHNLLFPLIMHFLKSTQFMIFAFGVQLGR